MENVTNVNSNYKNSGLLTYKTKPTKNKAHDAVSYHMKNHPNRSLPKPEAIYVKQEVTDEGKSSAGSEYDCDTRDLSVEQDHNRPTDDEELHENRCQKVKTEDRETYLPQPEIIYIKEEFTDDFSKKSKAESEYNPDSSDQSDEEDLLYQYQTLAKDYTDTKKKSLVCKICGKQFCNSSVIKIHMRVHTKEKPYACKLCGKAFSKSYDVTLHMRIHTKEKPYTCTVCGRAFSHVSHLIVHERTHTKEKPYSCKVCGKMFSKSSNVTVHMRTHTKEKPYACQVCGKKFSQSAGVKKHTLTHTKGKSNIEARTEKP